MRLALNTSYLTTSISFTFLTQSHPLCFQCHVGISFANNIIHRQKNSASTCQWIWCTWILIPQLVVILNLYILRSSCLLRQEVVILFSCISYNRKIYYNSYNTPFLPKDTLCHLKSQPAVPSRSSHEVLRRKWIGLRTSKWLSFLQPYYK